MFHEAIAMEYRAIRFEIMQTANPCCWKWVVFLDETRMQTGIALTRADAVLDAESAIDNVYQQRVGELRDK
jgi:hypothetical protein